MNEETLRGLRADHDRKLADAKKRVTAERDRTIMAAHDAGYSGYKIAKLTGYSQSVIGDILKAAGRGVTCSRCGRGVLGRAPALPEGVTLICAECATQECVS